MIKRMEDTGRPLTERDLADLESELGFKLPQAYRAFLMKYNGGRPEPEAFPIEGMPNNPEGAALPR